MNFFPNPYFSYFDPNFVPESIVLPSTFKYENQNENKYVTILENQNRLLREKLDVLEKRLKSYEQIEKENESGLAKKQESQKLITEHRCQYPNCDRSYKSSLALNLHIKTKHNGGSIRERQAYAKLLIQCERENKPRPQININFPPNFLQNYRKKMLSAQNLMKQQQQ